MVAGPARLPDRLRTGCRPSQDTQRRRNSLHDHPGGETCGTSRVGRTTGRFRRIYVRLFRTQKTDGVQLKSDPGVRASGAAGDPEDATIVRRAVIRPYRATPPESAEASLSGPALSQDLLLRQRLKTFMLRQQTALKSCPRIFDGGPHEMREWALPASLQSDTRAALRCRATAC